MTKAKAAPPPTPAARKALSKLDILITLLSRTEGATLPELTIATDWQAHSVRGAMSGALKKGRSLTILSEKVEGIRTYRIAAAPK